MGSKGRGWHGEKKRHSEVQAKVATKDILRRPITIVTKIIDKGYPTSESDYLKSHRLAEQMEKKLFGIDNFNELEEIISNKLPSGQLIGAHGKDRSIKVSSLVPEKFINEVVIHEITEHELMQAGGGDDATVSAKHKIIKINEEALNRFIKNKTNKLSSNGLAVALRTPDFIFISKDIAPHQLPELYQKLTTAHSGGSVSLEMDNGKVIVKNIDEEIRKHEQAIAKAGNNLSIRMHSLILKALMELERERR